MRAVFDPNVLVSAAISPDGAPARLIARWWLGEFELVVSEELLEELARVLEYPKLQPHVAARDAEELIFAIRAEAAQREQPGDGHHVRSRDPDDNYLIDLAAASGAALVSETAICWS